MFSHEYKRNLFDVKSVFFSKLFVYHSRVFPFVWAHRNFAAHIVCLVVVNISAPGEWRQRNPLLATTPSAWPVFWVMNF